MVIGIFALVIIIIALAAVSKVHTQLKTQDTLRILCANLGYCSVISSTIVIPKVSTQDTIV